MNIATLLTDPFGLSLQSISSAPQVVTLVIRSTPPQSACPRCQQLSTRVHSRYVRGAADLPWQGVAVRLQLHARRFFCLNDGCPQQIFCERLAEVIAPHARRTLRLNEALRLIGFALGGNPGARLALSLGMSVSHDTLLRRIRRAALPAHPTPRVLGVDDWAKRKGHRYGRILVDLEQRRPIDLLPDREAETLAAWLRAHPGVEVISRDRSGAYADGARKGAPAALQVADRFHLLQNLTETVQRYMSRQQKLIGQAVERLRPKPAAPAAAIQAVAEKRDEPAPISAARVKQRVTSRGEHRYERYLAVREMHRQGASILSIAEHFRMHRRTVRLFLRAEEYPERARTQVRDSQVERYVPYLKQRWDAGCHNAAQLYREIRAQGFRGKARSLRQYLERWRAQLPLALQRRRKNEAGDYPLPPVVLSSRRTAWHLLRAAEELTAEQRSLIEQLCLLSPEVAAVQQLGQAFQQMVKGREVGKFEDWLRAAQESGVVEMQGFATSLQSDRAAVEAALSTAWSQGQVEGQITRLKLIKREMFGRANFDLLRRRVLQAA